MGKLIKRPVKSQILGSNSFLKQEAITHLALKQRLIFLHLLQVQHQVHLQLQLVEL